MPLSRQFLLLSLASIAHLEGAQEKISYNRHILLDQYFSQGDGVGRK